MPKKKTHKEFVEEIFKLVGDEYSVVSEYKNSLTKVTLKHNKCNHTYEILPSKFTYRNQRCPNCNKYKPKSLEYIINRIDEDGNDEYELIGEYTGTNNNTVILHKVCGYKWIVSPKYFLESENKCPYCSKNLRKKTTDDFVREVKSLVSNEYTVVGEYKPNEKVSMRHNLCNHTWSVNPSSFLRGTRCPNCNGGIRKTTEQFKEEVFNLVGDEYTVEGEYVNNITRIPIIHDVCKETSMLCPVDFLGGVRCLHCNTSKGEKQIYSYLRNANCEFEMQFKFEDCKNKKELPFDFAVFNKNKLILLIEYDGIQHFKEIEVFGGEIGLQKTLLRDSIKNTYCETNNIPLLRIPYWDFDNIEEILDRELHKLI